MLRLSVSRRSGRIRAHPRVSETCFAVLDHHAALRCNRAGCELCGCLAAPSCHQSCCQGKSRGHRRLQPGNGGECRPRRRPLRPLRPERGREARRAGAPRCGAGGVERAVPQGERERLRVHERVRGRHARGPCPSEGVPSTRDDDVGASRVCGTEHAIAARRSLPIVYLIYLAFQVDPEEVGAGGIY